MAKLYFRYGAMNSGKSTGLLQTAYNYEERGQRVLLIKAVVDTKGEDSVVSRLGVSRRVDLLVDADDDLRAWYASGPWPVRSPSVVRVVLSGRLCPCERFLTVCSSTRPSSSRPFRWTSSWRIALIDDVPSWLTGSVPTSARSASQGRGGCWRSPIPWRS